MLYTLIWLDDYYTIKCNRIRLKYNIMSVGRKCDNLYNVPIEVSHIINSQKLTTMKLTTLFCIIINNIITWNIEAL